MGDIQTTPEGHSYKVSDREQYDTWPQSETHTWGMFAGLAVELGGYGDIELIEPSTGQRFWFQPSREQRDQDCGQPAGQWPFVKVLRQAIDAAEAVGWFDDGTDHTEVGAVPTGE